MLAGVTALDLGDEVSALAGELLAELGAEVIRVEDERGDPVRTAGPLSNAIHNAGKRSIAIDSTSDAAWESVAALLPSVDIVIGPLECNEATARFLERVRLQAKDRGDIGLVEIVLRRDGRDEPATDLTATAAGGLTWLCGHPDDPPNHPAGSLAWKQTSLVAANAAVMLITSLHRAGTGGHVVVSVAEAVAFTTLQTANGNIWHWHGTVPGRHANPAAFTTVRAGDGKWTSFTIHPPNWSRFVEWAEQAVGVTGLTGPEWTDLDYVAANRSQVYDIVVDLAASMSQVELIDGGQSRGLLVLPVNEVADVAADRHLAARGFWVEVDDGGAGGGLRLAGSPFRSSLGRAKRGPAPELGADNHLLVGDQRPAVDRWRTGSTDQPPRQPLAGIRIVDFGWAIAGPLTTRLLADLGADVIKLESDNRLDPIRYIGPQPSDERSIDTNGVFNDCNANKRALTVNVDTEAGRDIARRLIATADIVTANYTPDRLDRWGFDHAALEALRPGIIVANLAVMGLEGPDMGWRSYGSGLVAMCGLAAHTGFEGRTPDCLGTLHTDFTVPYFAAMQIMAALHHRQSTGEGAYLELSQYESAVRLMDEELALVLNGHAGPGRTANGSSRFNPHGVFPLDGNDRWVAIACRDDGERAALATVVGSPAGVSDEQLTAYTRVRTAAQVVADLQRAGVPVAPVADQADLHQDPVAASQWEVLQLPAGVSARVIHEPITWDAERLPLRPAPMWFEHTYEILVDELGLSAEDFSDLVARQVLW